MSKLIGEDTHKGDRSPTQRMSKLIGEDTHKGEPYQTDACTTEDNGENDFKHENSFCCSLTYVETNESVEDLTMRSLPPPC